MRSTGNIVGAGPDDIVLYIYGAGSIHGPSKPGRIVCNNHVTILYIVYTIVRRDADGPIFGPIVTINIYIYRWYTLYSWCSCAEDTYAARPIPTLYIYNSISVRGYCGTIWPDQCGPVLFNIYIYIILSSVSYCITSVRGVLCGPALLRWSGPYIMRGADHIICT